MDVFHGVEGGEEVFNTYGMLGNTQLLSYYGFTQDTNPEDYVDISGPLLRAVCALEGAFCISLGFVMVDTQA